jgi:ribosome assembly protein 1
LQPNRAVFVKSKYIYFLYFLKSFFFFSIILLIIREKSVVNNYAQALSLEEIAKKRELVRQMNENNQSTQSTHPSPLIDKPIEEIKEKHEFFAFARVFSGTLRKGQTLFVLSPKHNPDDFTTTNENRITLSSDINEIQNVSKNVTKFTVNELYLMMGRSLEIVDEIPCNYIIILL